MDPRMISLEDIAKKRRILTAKRKLVKINFSKNRDDEDIDPFFHKTPYTYANCLQIILMSFTIAPIRCLCILVISIFGWIISMIGMIGMKDDDLESKPLDGWRRSLQTLLYRVFRAIYFCMGIHRVNIIGQQADRSVAPVIVAAPHGTYIDPLAVICSHTTPVVKGSLKFAPLLGTLGRFWQTLFVDRECAVHRKDIRKKIVERAKSQAQSKSGSNWRQVFVFPEGTTTNSNAVIRFKTGAFQAGLPVQMLIVRFAQMNTPDTLAWTWHQAYKSPVILFWLTICQLHTKVELEWLPVYYPDAAERDDMRLFADNVQLLFAEKIGIPAIDRRMEEVLEMN